MSRTVKFKDIRFTLNGKNQKDALIIDFLDKQYSTNDYIKQVLYRLACDDLKAAYVQFNGNIPSKTEVNSSANNMETSSHENDYINEEDKFQMQDINSAFDSIPDETNDSVVYMKEPTPIPIGVKPVKYDEENTE